MTLIAAYRPFGIPVLLGDFLITGGTLKSARKKIYKISSNFVIGWTGNVIDARPLMKQIFEKFEDKIVTLQEVEKFLTARPVDKNLTESLHLIGWIIENNNPHCFLWNIAYPTELYFEPFHTDGTGGESFKALITRENLGGSLSPSSRSSIEQSIHTALAKVAELYSDEILEKINQKQGFGHGYELLYFDGNEFRYLENIAFSGMDILIDSAGNVADLGFYDLWYRYHSLGDASFLQITNNKTGDIILEAIEPVFRKKLRDASFEFTAGSFRADYYCFYLRMQIETNGLYKGSFVLPEIPIGPSRHEKIIDNKWAFVLEKELITNIYFRLKNEQEYYQQNLVPFGWGAAEAEQRLSGISSRFEFQVDQTDKCVVVGLLIEENWNLNYNSLNYALMCNADLTIGIYEKGFAVGPYGIKYSETDTFNLEIIEIDGVPTVAYIQNGTIIYQSNIPPELPLKIKIAIKEDGASVKNMLVYNLV